MVSMVSMVSMVRLVSMVSMVSMSYYGVCILYAVCRMLCTCSALANHPCIGLRSATAPPSREPGAAPVSDRPTTPSLFTETGRSSPVGGGIQRIYRVGGIQAHKVTTVSQSK
jgi:hypothetical protein